LACTNIGYQNKFYHLCLYLGEGKAKAMGLLSVCMRLSPDILQDSVSHSTEHLYRDTRHVILDKLNEMDKKKNLMCFHTTDQLFNLKQEAKTMYKIRHPGHFSFLSHTNKIIAVLFLRL
jgi:hypothetical protein